MTAAAMPPASRLDNVPWRVLVVLALLVLGAHLLILQVSPARMGPPLELDATARAFTTRSIAAQPAVQVAPPALAAPAVPVTTAKPIPPKKASKQPLAQVLPTPFAIDLAANPTLENTPPAPAEAPADSTAVASTATMADITAAPLPAAASVSVSAAAPQREQAPPASAAVASAGPAPTVVTAISLPGSARLQYKVLGTSKGLNYFADSELNWNNAGSSYDATMKVSALFIGSRSMTSTGAVTSTGLAPTRFADKYKNEVAAHFDAGKGKVTFSANTPDVPWMEGAQDRVSVFLQLGGMLAAGPGGAVGSGEAGAPRGFGVGSSITLYTVGPRDADTWTFMVEAAEQLSLPSGDMATLKLTRKPRREYDQKVEVWFAPSLGFLPVRNRITQANGDFVDQQLKSVVRP